MFLHLWPNVQCKSPQFCTISHFFLKKIKSEQAFTSGKDTTGAMTYTLIKAIKEKPSITYAGLLDYMHEAIEAVNRTRNRVLKVFQPKMDQVLAILLFPAFTSFSSFPFHSSCIATCRSLHYHLPKILTSTKS